MLKNSIQNEHDLVNMLLASAERVGKLAEAEALEAEKKGTISQNIIDQMKKEEFHRLLLPKKYGGPQINLKTFTDIISKMAYYNVSAAWVANLYILHNVFVSYLPSKVRDEIVNSQGLLCDVFAPVGKVEKAGQGVRVTGRWDFCSGILYAEWVGLGVIVELPDSPRPELCLAWVNTKDLTILNNWDTFALRGSGSNSVVVDNVYVPFEYLMRVEQAAATSRPPEEDYDKEYPYYDTPFLSTFGIGFMAIAIGGAKRIISDFKEISEKRVRMTFGAESTPQVSQQAQRVAAELTADLFAAEALMEQYIQFTEKFNRNEGTTTRAEFFALRAKAIKICADIATRAFYNLGGYVLSSDNPTQRMVRDVMAVAIHKATIYEDSVNGLGRDIFGYMDPNELI